MLSRDDGFARQKSPYGSQASADTPRKIRAAIVYSEVTNAHRATLGARLHEESVAQRAENFVSLLTLAVLWFDCQHPPSDVLS
jgi:hypothetical protein